MSDICFIYSTVAGKEEALLIADAIVSEKLAACANVIDNMTSVYWWEDNLQKDEEVVLILKTTVSLLIRSRKESASCIVIHVRV
ncbi:MAG: divalent cation tolerance protein CutA [Candidatus Tantalella remota]|nr:divalent cation tolerance protein CutA [Candidatus Tantalella remota]